MEGVIWVYSFGDLTGDQVVLYKTNNVWLIYQALTYNGNSLDCDIKLHYQDIIYSGWHYLVWKPM